jgi:hypothetical protein
LPPACQGDKASHLTDPDLALVVKAWPDLPRHIRQTIISIVAITPKSG